MIKILFIPHHPIQKALRFRLAEIAGALGGGNDVYLVNWKAPESAYSLWGRIMCSLKDLFKVPRSYRDGNVTVVEFPTLHRPLGLARAFNSFWLKGFIDREKIDAVINGSYYMFGIPEERSYKYIFDIADMPLTGESASFDRFVHLSLVKETKKADAVTASSRSLADYMSKNYGCKTFFLPNGGDVGEIRTVREDKVRAVKEKYGLSGKWVIGYIGQIGSWVDTGLAVEAFRKIKAKHPDAVLMWIGLCPNIKNPKSLYPDEDIIFTGGIEEDAIDSYFNALDVAILPLKKSIFQDMAFHIKLIEFTAARKVIVSSPLDEVKRIGFPNIITVDFDAGKWAEAIERSRSIRWDPLWDSLVDEYDWQKIADKAIGIIDNIRRH